MNLGMNLGGWQYALALLATFGLSTALTPLMRRVALSRQVMDGPDVERKTQLVAVPYLGGVAIAVSVSTVLVVAALLRGTPRQDLLLIAGVLLPALALAVVGLIDDLRGLMPLPRFLAQSLAGAVTAAFLGLSGAGASLSGIAWIDLPITMFWVIGVTNALNLLDNTDGAASGTAAIAALSLFAVAALNGQFLVAALAVALSGACFGFLVWNKEPARIYMGDSGSLFIGFMLAAIAIRINLESSTQLAGLAVPVIILFVPILDTSVVVVSRLRRGVSPFQGGLDHVAHRLRRVGSGVRGAVGRIWGATSLAGVLAVVVSRVSAGWAALLVALASLAFVAAFVYVIRLPETGDMH